MAINDDIAQRGFRENLEAWRLGKVSAMEVEAALRLELKDPRSVPAAYSLIETYRQAGYITTPFADRLLQLQSTPAAAALTLLRPAPIGTKPAADVPAHTTYRKVESAPGTAGPDLSFAPAVDLDPGGPLQAGSLLGGQYVLEGVLPGGDPDGLGTVFKARDLIQQEALDRRPYVAIKVFHREINRRPDAVAALHGEYKKALQLSHPNIVKVQNFSHDGDEIFMVMELLEGRSLRDVIGSNERRGFTQVQALAVIGGLSRGLAYAHRLGIVHADFEPRKAFLTDEKTAKVLDFGIARAIGRPAAARVYASAEQLEGAAPDPRDDVYALAVVSYELLTGRHPFGGHDALTARHAGVKPLPVPGLSRRQWHTFQAALSFSRAHRPSDAHFFADGLAPKKRPALLMAAAALALLLVASAAIVLAHTLYDRARADRIAAALSAPDREVVADAVRRLSLAGDSTRAAVLSRDGAMNAVMSVFERRARALFDPAANLLDYPGALASLAPAHRLLPDYAPLRQLEESLAGERQHKVAELALAFENALAVYNLRDSDDPAGLLSVRRQLQALEPSHALLRDARVPAAYRRAAADAWTRSDSNLTDVLLREGLSLSPGDPGLTSLAEEVRHDRETRLSGRSADELAADIDKLADRNARLPEFRVARDELNRLQAIAPGNAALVRAQARLQSLVDTEINADLARQEVSSAQTQLGEFGGLLNADFLHGKQSIIAAAAAAARSRESRTEALRREVDGLIAAPRAQEAWVTHLRSTLADLNRISPQEPKIAATQADAGRFLIEQARQLRSESRYDEAKQLLSWAASLGVPAAQMQPETEALRQAREQAELEQTNRAQDANLEGAKQRVLALAQAGADGLDKALDLYQHVRKELPPGDPWTTSEAPRALADGYLQRAQTLAESGQFAAAQLQCQKIRALPITDPYYDARLTYFNRLATLQMQLQVGNLTGAAQIAEQLQRGDGRGYAALEPLFAKLVTERIKILSHGHRDEAAKLADAARSLFPTQQFVIPD